MHIARLSHFKYVLSIPRGGWEVSRNIPDYRLKRGGMRAIVTTGNNRA